MHAKKYSYQLKFTSMTNCHWLGVNVWCVVMATHTVYIYTQRTVLSGGIVFTCQGKEGGSNRHIYNTHTLYYYHTDFTLTPSPLDLFGGGGGGTSPFSGVAMVTEEEEVFEFLLAGTGGPTFFTTSSPFSFCSEPPGISRWALTGVPASYIVS